MNFRWTVSQIGARQHYGVPRGFLHRGDLRLLYTEVWCRHGQSKLARGPAPLRALAGRYHPEIPNSKVVSFNFRTFHDLIKSKDRERDVVAEHKHYIHLGKWFSTQVARDLSRRELDPQQDLFFGFNTGCLETIQMLRERGITTVCDQIDPARVEEQLVFEEAERWAGWQKMPGRIPAEYWERMDAEWATASMVLVNSDWSRKALVSQGVAAEKIVVIPPPYEPVKLHLPARRNFDQPITVLWLGLVNLRKGIQYLMEAARLLQHNPRIRFVVAGPILISEQAVKSAPPNMQFLGKITRTETGPLYRQADVFVLPTLSDGFAVSQLEAMSQALPVIATPNCGEVVTDGVDGFIVPPFSGAALAEAIQKLDDDRQLLRDMSYRAIEKSTHYYLPRQVLMLEDAVTCQKQGLPLNNPRYHLVPGRPPMREMTNVVITIPVPQKTTPRVAMIQDGARRRYMVPLALQQAGLLDRVYIDWLVRESSIEAKVAKVVAKFQPGLGRRMGERTCAELDPSLVVSNWFLSLRLQMKMRKIPVPEESFLYGSRRTAEWILKEGFGDANILCGFVRNASPDLFRAARKQGLRTCADQIIAPYQVEVQTMVEEQRRWPGWSDSETATMHAEYQKFETETWDQLDRITCMSDYVRDGLISVGVPSHRITVIPYPWNETVPDPVERNNRSGPLTIGFVGVVGLRKGCPYFLEVAKRFDPRRFKFVMVGNVLLDKDRLAPYQDHVTFTGKMARSQVKDWLKKFDIFFFPSTCEGSAGAVMEAMASGIPVLTTPSSGSVAQHGIDGFVHRFDEVDKFETAIRQLDADRDLMHRMGQSARQRILTYDLRAYGSDLRDLFNELVNAPMG